MPRCLRVASLACALPSGDFFHAKAHSLLQNLLPSPLRLLLRYSTPQKAHSHRVPSLLNEACWHAVEQNFLPLLRRSLNSAPQNPHGLISYADFFRHSLEQNFRTRDGKYSTSAPHPSHGFLLLGTRGLPTFRFRIAHARHRVEPPCPRNSAPQSEQNDGFMRQALAAALHSLLQKCLRRPGPDFL